MEEQLNITRTLSAYIAQVDAARLPQPVVEKAKIHILDSIGAIISGSLLKPGRLMIDFARTQRGPEEATVPASNFKTGIVMAALANGTMAHADETDDAHFPTVSHPGSVAVSAALPVAEREHRSGKDLIAAVVLGYDVMCRTSKALDRQWMHDRGLHAGSMGGNFAAAAVASRLLSLHPEQIKYALALAGSQASGLSTWRQEREHIDKALSRAGLPARNGVTAALWAQAGFTGTPTIFEGPYNFIDSFSENAKATELTKDLGTRYEILDTSIKIYPVGQPIQATLHGYFTLVREHGLKANDIREVVVRLPEEQTHTINDRLIPDANCQYQLAVAMLDGKIDFHNAHDSDRMQAPDVLDMKKRVTLVADPELTKQFPAVRAAIVELRRMDGRCFEMLVDRLPGAPYNPLSAEEVEAKFLSLTVPILGLDNAQQIIEWTRNLDVRGDVSGLCPLLQAPDTKGN
jgi:2-methylcitrate dehydratase PrpD